MKDRSGRKRGAQPGQEGKGRPLLAWALDEIVEHWPIDCGCGHIFPMLAFRGHFVTKSRRYSTTLGELRAAYRAHQDTPPDNADDDGTTLVLSVWQYLGSGYRNPGTCSWPPSLKPRCRSLVKRLLDLRRQSP